MAKKRANGEGSIRKRKDGRWEGRYTAGHDLGTGKTIYKNVLGKTQGEVKEKLKKAHDFPLHTLSSFVGWRSCKICLLFLFVFYADPTGITLTKPFHRFSRLPESL